MPWRLRTRCWPAAPSGSRDNIGHELVFDAGNLVPELQLSLLETGHPKLIGRNPFGHGRNGGIQIAMLLNQRGERAAQAVLLGFGHKTALYSGSAPGAPLLRTAGLALFTKC